MRLPIIFLLLCFAANTRAQQKLIFEITDKETGEPVPATISVKHISKGLVSDSLGLAAIEFPSSGSFEINISAIGFEENNFRLLIPYNSDTVSIELEKNDEELEQVVVQSTRTSRTIANTPTRIELITGEELAEKANMKPGDIRMLLSESTGIQVQQTSATSYNAGIRIQGLDGRYTQILRDGYPLYSGFSGGLGLLQITPLDLRQVEVIKGSSSTLYGGGAIAGLVNLVSKTPSANRELSFLANATSAGGIDLSGFYSEKYKKTGLTIFAARNSSAPYDPADIGLTAIPKSERYTISPRLFLYGKNTSADIGINYITETRTGGNMNYIKNGTPGFFEKNNTDRTTSTIGITHKVNERSSVSFKNSYSRFNRKIEVPDYEFLALQQSSFSELTWNNQREKTKWAAGANVLTDDLSEKGHSGDALRDYHYNTYGIFVQNVLTVSKLFTLETGLRGDYVKNYGMEVLPRAFGMIRFSPKITVRAGGGYGYKTPTVFTEESERIQFKNILPIDKNRSKNERSMGGNVDINYRGRIGEVSCSINHMFFYTRLNHPLILVSASDEKLEFLNAPGHIDTKGMETNIRFVYHDFKLFLGYTYTDANTHYSEIKKWLPLTARHRLNNVLMYEIENKLKIGLEAYYFSKQQLSDATFGKSYWITGLMIEKIWKRFSVYINFENFTNTRQTKFDTIYTGTIDQPVFRDIYAPVEGFVTNGGVKIKL